MKHYGVFGSMITALATACTTVIGMCMFSQVHGSGEGLTIKDSQGRVRVDTQEDGDGFSFTLYDAKSRPRIVLRTEPNGDPTILLRDEAGFNCGMLGRDPLGSWAVTVRREDGLAARLVADADGNSGFMINAGGAPIAALACSPRADETRLYLGSPSSPSLNRTQMWSKGSESAGLVIERGSEHVAGIARVKEAEVVWLGSSPLHGGAIQSGFRAAHSSSASTALDLAHEGAYPISIITEKRHGARIRIGGDKESALIGINRLRHSKIELVGSTGVKEELISK